MSLESLSVESFSFQFRLFLEELCCDLCRFEHVARDGLRPEQVRITREVYLAPGAFADIRVETPTQPPYFVEVKHGYPSAKLLQHLRRKYGKETPALQGASKLVLVVDTDQQPPWPGLEAELAQSLVGGLKLEVWNMPRLRRLLQERFGIALNAITEEHVVELRNAVNHAKGFQAFGGKTLADFSLDGLQASLLWHLGFWRLRQLREQKNLTPREFLAPRTYPAVVIVMADLCSFSSYVRDTPDHAVVRDCLTAFYSKSRYQIINSGGMLSQFIGDEAVALFGIPDQRPGYLQDALETARTLVDIGDSVSNDWQRSIDRVQKSAGVHIGIAVGNLEMVSMQPFGRAPMGVIGDSINMAARLMACAGPGEIVISNAFYRDLGDAAGFQEMEPVEAHNIGSIKAWKWAAKDCRATGK
jgi:adenylate cyclase